MIAIKKLHPHDEYNLALKNQRLEFAESPVIRYLLSNQVDSKFVELFAIYFHVLSTGMIEPIPGFIEQAAQRCDDLGLFYISKYFHDHAKEEIGNEDRAKSDAERFANHWNEYYENPKLDAERLLDNRANSPGVKQYHRLHEVAIMSDAPYSLLAIANEIELIAVKYGPRMIAQCFWKLGPRALRSLSYVRHHLGTDFRHTRLNRKVMDDLIELHPSHLEWLIAIGRGALNAYETFLEDCMSYTRCTYLSPF